MNKKKSTQEQLELFNRANYTINSLEDELNSDKNCQELLKLFLKFMLENRKMEPLEAGSHARGADYFLRDYMIDRCRENIFAVSAEKISGFAGNWYIVNTLEPNMKELSELLKGLRLFYLFCEQHNTLEKGTFEKIDAECNKLAYFQDRIESFHALRDNEFRAWNDRCPIH